MSSLRLCRSKMAYHCLGVNGRAQSNCRYYTGRAVGDDCIYSEQIDDYDYLCTCPSAKSAALYEMFNCEEDE
jgi:hypothetical protein